MMSTSELYFCPVVTKMLLVRAVTDRRTVTKEETRNRVATPILYEKLFFDCVDQTL